jgi:hypothetical protein
MSDEKQYDEPIYKKWFKTKDRSGFISVTPWFDDEKGVAKFNVDVGTADAAGKLQSNTNAFVDAIKFATYMKSLSNGSGKLNYPSTKKKIDGEWIPNPDARTDESISFYGGSGDVARVLRIHYWQTAEKYDERSFVVKIGHFKGRSGANGAIIPDMSPEGTISNDLIKMTRPDIGELSYAIDLQMIKRLGH